MVPRTPANPNRTNSKKTRPTHFLIKLLKDWRYQPDLRWLHLMKGNRIKLRILAEKWKLFLKREREREREKNLAD